MKLSDLKEACDKKTFSILIPNGAVFGFVTIADIEMVLKVLLLTLTIVYTLWKWTKEANEKK